MYKKYTILGLFLLLVVISLLKPRVILNIYNNILGRVLLIGVVLFFTSCNVALGLLSALFLIIASNMVFMEGLTNLNNAGLTIGDDNVNSTNDTNNKVIVTTNSNPNPNPKGTESTISDLIAQAESSGIDRQSIQESIQPKDSKTIPVDKKIFESTDVNPSDPTTKSGNEGFSNYISNKLSYRNFKS